MIKCNSCGYLLDGDLKPKCVAGESIRRDATRKQRFISRPPLQARPHPIVSHPGRRSIFQWGKENDRAKVLHGIGYPSRIRLPRFRFPCDRRAGVVRFCGRVVVKRLFVYGALHRRPGRICIVARESDRNSKRRDRVFLFKTAVRLLHTCIILRYIRERKNERKRPRCKKIFNIRTLSREINIYGHIISRKFPACSVL